MWPIISKCTLHVRVPKWKYSFWYHLKAVALLLFWLQSYTANLKTISQPQELRKNLLSVMTKLHFTMQVTFTVLTYVWYEIFIFSSWFIVWFWCRNMIKLNKYTSKGITHNVNSRPQGTSWHDGSHTVYYYVYILYCNYS